MHNSKCKMKDVRWNNEAKNVGIMKKNSCELRP